MPRRVVRCVMAHTNVFHFLAEDGDNAIIRICATGSRGEGEGYFMDGFLKVFVRCPGGWGGGVGHV